MMKELHVARNLEELKKSAQFRKDKIKNKISTKSAEKLYRIGLANLNDGDEENAYIYFVRFLLVYDMLANAKDDNGYTKKILGTEHNTVSVHLSKLDSSLKNRYVELKIQEPTPHIIEEHKPKLDTTVTFSFPSGYITCQELYNIIQNKCDIVILDARPAEDFKESCMKHPACVNIPENIIQSGLSANKLSIIMPEESLAQWNRRWECNYLILLDWSSTRETISASKLAVLSDILVNWDTSMSNSNPPIVLNGGYLELLDMYPTVCKNPQLVFQVRNSALNELLDIDTIEYPTTEDTTPPRFLIPQPQQPVVDRATKPVYADENVVSLHKNMINLNQQVHNKQIEYANLENLRKKRHLEAEEGMRLELQLREEKLLKDMASLEKRQEQLNLENEELKKKLKLYAYAEEKINTNIEEINPDISARDRLLLEARAEKKNLLPDTNISLVDNKKYNERVKFPTIDRKSKPVLKTLVDPGVTGLKNFGTTCYMNSVIQCLSNTKNIKNYFCDPNCIQDVNEDHHGMVVTSFASLIQDLWSGQHKFISPKLIRDEIKKCYSRFDNREQQDAHEFLLSLTNCLHEDLKKDICRPIQAFWTPREKSWVEQTEGKFSIINSTFCGQVKNRISCDLCHKFKDKFEIFENLSLPIPIGDDCTLEDCLQSYFSKQPIIGYACPQCKSTKRVFQQSSLVSHPAVLVIILKRFSESYESGSYTFKKNLVSLKGTFDLQLFNVKYNLYAVVNHRGTLEHGHYVALCKSPRTKRWFKYDDNIVTEIEKDAALNGTQVYIMFFEKEESVTNAKLC